MFKYSIFSSARLSVLPLLLALLLACGISKAGTLNDYNPYNVSIPDNGGSVNSDLLLSGAPGNATITKVKVYYEIRHTYPGDLDIWLTTYYDGAWHDYFLYHQGDLGSTDNVIETRDNIHTWDGASPNQTWYLTVRDKAGGDVGYIDFFELWVTYNVPPDTPSNPGPSDGETGVSINADLDWSCTDPDGDTLYYTVYFEKNDSTPDPTIKNDSTGSSANLGTLDYDSHYYWQVEVDDHKGGVTWGATWDFYTESNPNGNLNVQINGWPGGTGRVVLYRGASSWQSSIGSDGIAHFTNKTAASDYSYEVYYTGARGEEYWGDRTNVTIPSGGSTATSNFSRFYPYATSFVLRNDTTDQVINPGDSIEPGTTVRAEVTIYNGLSGQALNCYVQTIYDRNQASPYDASPNSAIISVSAQSSGLFTTTFTPSAEGTYYKALKVYAQLGSGDQLTDGTAFEQALIVESTFPDLSGRIAFHSYSSYDNMDGVLKICDMPSQNTYTISEVLNNTKHQMNPNFSPDGSLVAFMAVPANSAAVPGSFWSYLEIYLYDFVTQQLIPLTNNINADEDPKFSPDGSKIVFKRGGDVHVMTLDGSVMVPSLTSTADEESGPYYSPAGINKIAYWFTYYDGGYKNERIWWMNNDGTSPEQLVPDSDVRIMYYPVFLDSERLAYTRWLSNPTELDQLHIYNFNTDTDSPVAFRDDSANDSDAFPLYTLNLMGFSSTRAGSGYDLYIGDLQSGDAWDLTLANTSLEDLGACFTTLTNPPSTRTITVASIPNGASFTISGEGVNNFEETATTPWTNNQMQPGNYTINWGPITGYVTPASETKYLVSGAIGFTGNYSQSPLGTITISPFPDSLNAPWSIDGPNGYSLISQGDQILTDREHGDYILTWGMIDNWNLPIPAQETKTLPPGSSMNFSGTYTLPNPNINSDHIVNFIDFSIFAGQWANSCIVPDWCNGADLNHSGTVDFNDLLIMVENWLETNINDGLTAYWSFDEGSGTTAEDVIGGNDGTLNGDPNWVDGISGKALDFDGSGDYVDVANSPDLNPTDAITITAWFKAESFALGSYAWPSLVAKYTSGVGGYSLSVQKIYESTPQITASIYLEDLGPGGHITLQEAPPTEVVLPNILYFTAMTYNGSEFTLYRAKEGDATPSISAISSGSGKLATSDSHLNIAESPYNPGRYWNGLIDEVRIYNRALTSAEIEYLYQNP